MANTASFSISEIASWASPAPEVGINSQLHVQLPALQRGAVWSAYQVEQLWDSLIRGFPIGCLILSEPQPHLGTKPFPLQREAREEGADSSNGHGNLLLDGQQRSTAIAVAFLDPWRNPEHVNAEFALWVDLEPPQKSMQSNYVFRLLTLSHPWGYKRQNSAERLSTSARRDAMKEYEACACRSGPCGLVFRPGHLPLIHAWPYDAGAPVPVILIDAIRSSPANADDATIWRVVQEDVKSLLGAQFDWVASEMGKGTERLKTISSLLNLLSVPTAHMAQLLRGLRRLLNDGDHGIRIPAQWLPREHLAGVPPDEGHEREDPVLTLFVRINTAGVQPDGEELAYSILKSVMPECREGVEALSRRFMPPARMVLLLSTLTLANLSHKGNEDTPPAFPDVNRFRRLIQGVDKTAPNFGHALRTMLQDGSARSVVDAAYRLLVIDPKNPDERSFRLLPLQAARIAQNDEHAFLLLFSWIRSRKDLNEKWLGLDEAEHRRLVGLMCVLSWFYASDRNTATNRRNYLARLWKRRAELHEKSILAKLTKPLVDHSKKEGMTELTKPEGNDLEPILPLPPPAVLHSAIEHCVTGFGFGGHATKLWEEWDLWTNFRYKLEDIPKAAEWYKNNVTSQTSGNDIETPQRLTERREAAWNGLIARTINNTEFVLYAQRHRLSHWYPEFDPTNPSHLKDTEQPWDFDHIHAQNYVQGLWGMPPLIKAWHATIGNLRAWPSEINRSQRDLPPKEKISNPNVQENRNYGLRSASNLRDASAIKNQSDWEQSHPGPGTLNNYLRNNSPDTAGYHPYRQALVRAITTRYVTLYAGWYKELRVNELF
jgi:hypothetical protein